MDIAKYVSLISRGQLFFCKADKFEDPFEGELNNVTKANLQEWYMSDIPKAERTTQIIEQTRNKLGDYVGFMKILKPRTTINSWHQNNEENFAMWKIYSNWNSGLAITTTYERAKACFDSAHENIYGGLVNYIKEDKQIVDQSNTFNHFMTKRGAFSYENELRFIHEIPELKETDEDTMKSCNGIYINVNLSSLIDKVYVAPQAESWLKDAVIDLNKKYGINSEVRQSSFFSSEDYT